MTKKNEKSSLLDNKNRGKVGEYLIDNIEKGSNLSIVSAYFTIYAYNEMKEKLDNIEQLNFLFGEPTFLKNMNPELLKAKEFQIEDSSYNISIKNRLKQKKVAKECAKWIEEKVNIKSMVKPNFLHGKMYYIENPNKDPKAIIGSSNFTYSGLGFDSSKNIELNMYLNDKRDSNDVKEWFEEIWNDKTGLVEDVKTEVLEYLNKLYKENSPELVYLFTLYNIFKDYLDNEKNFLEEEQTFKETKIWNMLYDFQKDAVKGAISKIEKHGGCIIADSVGLGKTFEALAVIKYYELKNDRVMVLCPKRLHQNWDNFLGNIKNNILYEDKLSYDIFFHTDLSRTSGKAANGKNLKKIMWDKYDLVVIDESHNFRNNKAVKEKQTRYNKLMEDIIKAGKRTKVLLLSATPINTNLNDLKNQLNLITKEKNDALKDYGIENMNSTLIRAQRNFNKWAEKKHHEEKISLIQNMDSDFFKLLDEYTISRSRTHIIKYYDTKKIGKFPERLKPISIYSKLDEKENIIKYDTLNEIILNLKLAIYFPSNYIRKAKIEDFSEKYDTKVKEGKTTLSQKDREESLVKMMKSNYLKRLESSINSFSLSIERLSNKINTLIEKIENFIDNKEKYKELYEEIQEELEQEEQNILEDITVEGKIQYNLLEMKTSEWLSDLKKDHKILEKILLESKKIDEERDAKLQNLVKIITQKTSNPINKNNKKALIFTAFSDTAYYLYNYLKKWAEKQNMNIAVVTGSGRNFTTYGKNNFEEILTNFSPISKNRNTTEKEIDILIATDCISEGQNLQDCDYLINYDIHWNPVRIIQRFGRIDRIGSKNKIIQLLNFWPEEDLEKYINLEKRVKSRMTLLDIASSGNENMLEIPEENIEFDFRAEQLKKMQNEIVDLEELNETITLTDFTLNDFKIDLSNYIDTNKSLLEKTPKGIYSIVPSANKENFELIKNTILTEKTNEIIKPGIIFCLKLKEEKTEKIKEKLDKFNPVSPYFLTYIYENGDIKYTYTNLKQILDIYKLLCSNKKTPIKELTDLFNKETNEGENMEKYSNLLLKTVEKIKGNIQNQNIKTLGAGMPRGQLSLLNKKEQIQNEEEFELISFLIIKNQGE